MKNMIKYVGIILVNAGILLVMKNLFSKDTEWNDNKDESKKAYYNVEIKILDKETKKYISGAKMILKDESDKVISEWTSENKANVVKDLSKGSYVLIQEKAPENYHLATKISFKIKSNDKTVTMYNKKMTKEEIEAENKKNTVSSEVGVDNTSSNKSILSIIISTLVITLGLGLIYKEKKNY